MRTGHPQDPQVRLRGQQRQRLRLVVRRDDDLATSPTTWLALQFDATTNFSFEPGAASEAAGPTTAGFGLLTLFQRVRFEPESSRIFVQDARHATASGFVSAEGVRTRGYFGVTRECVGDGSSEGRANVDLMGLPFALDSMWSARGLMARGGERNRTTQRVDLVGGGNCGGVFPDGEDYRYRAMYIRVRYAP